MSKIHTLGLVAAAILLPSAGFAVGQGYEQHVQSERELDAWSRVRVLRDTGNGVTLIANPSALTPEELADVRIVAPFTDMSTPDSVSISSSDLSALRRAESILEAANPDLSLDIERDSGDRYHLYTV